MAIHSTMLPLGTPAPEFSLPDVTAGESVSLSDFSGKKALLIIFLCRHCPYVRHIKGELTKLGQNYKGKDVAIVGIASNDIASYPEDAPESMAEFAKEEGFTFPILYDESQAIATAYTAACTPDFFLFDRDRKLVYRGQLDDARPKNDELVTGKDVRTALNAVLSDQPVSQDQRPSTGCSIKWKPGNELISEGQVETRKIN